MSCLLTYKQKITFACLERELKKVSERVEGLKFPQGFLEYLLYLISEIFSNIKEHSQAKKVFIDIKITPRKSKIEIADDGIGFRKSYLRQKIYPKDDFSAIEFALGGLSTKDPRERGFGLFSIRKLTEVLNGKLIIETGSGRAVIEKGRINFQKNSRKRAGTLVSTESPVRKIDFYKTIK